MKSECDFFVNDSRKEAARVGTELERLMPLVLLSELDLIRGWLFINCLINKRVV